MTKVSTGWNGFDPKSGIRHLAHILGRSSGAAAPPPYSSGSEQQQISIFIALPKKRLLAQQGDASGQASNTGLVYFEKPDAAKSPLLLSNVGRSTSKRAIRLVARTMPLVVLVATIFAAIGMLRMVVESVSMPQHYPSAFLKTQSWRGGAGPSPLDAVKSDYQNALTREMVAAMDTSAATKEVTVKRRKAKTDTRITVSASRYKSSVKDGLHNLKLRVFNGTQNILDRVTVEVDFFGRRGKLLKSETFTTTEVAPSHEKEITIPEGTPGLKVQYRISEVRSKKHTTQLQHL